MEKIKYFLISEKGKNILLVAIIILVGTGSFALGKLSNDSSSGIKIEYPPALSETNSTSGNISQSTSETSANKILKGVSSSQNLANVVTATQATSIPSLKSFFASNRGSKYYPSGCSAGKTIKMENRVYFSTRAEATAAGYTLSSSCN
ncbi:MAG: hypothetical protein ABIS26_02435 [Candidatus Paceibacterota bacterium]